MLTFLAGSQTRKVALSVHISDTGFPTFTKGDIVRFDTILANLGDGYNANTGYFTAPVKGLYFFMLYFMTYDSQSNLAIYANDNRICTASAVSNHDVATCSAFVQLAVGEVISVRVAYGAKLFYNNENHKNEHALVGFLYSS